MKKQILFICCAVIAYCLSACNTAPQQVPLKEKNLPKHVILIGFDGLSAHCLNNGRADRLPYKTTCCVA